MFKSPAFQRRHGHSGPGVGVDHAVGILPVLVDRAVDNEPGRVEGIFGGLDQVPVQVDLHQTGSRHLVVAQPVRIDQKVVFGTGHAERDMPVDQLAPVEVVDDPVAGRELDPQIPFDSIDFPRNLCDYGCLYRRHG